MATGGALEYKSELKSGAMTIKQKPGRKFLRGNRIEIAQ
jgi:hypothetical protein